MAVFKSLTFDGINSLDYGIYVTGEAVYNAPERVVEMVEIPGRNGSLAIDQGRFTNIEVSYPCGCFAETQADFAAKVSAFRNAIASRYSYKRLTDEYNTDEYRLGLYKSGLEVSAVRYGTAGQFTITFDCKPQRFLLDGDAELSPTDYSDVHTVSGDIVQIDNDGSLGVKSLTASLEPIQDLHGYDKPWSGGAGKNLCKPYEWAGTSAGVQVNYTENGVTLNGTATQNTDVPASGEVPQNGIFTLKAGTYKPSTDDANAGIQIVGLNPTEVLSRNGNAFTLASDRSVFARVSIYNGRAYNNLTVHLQLEAGSTATSYEPYSNICPISGHTECETYVVGENLAKNYTFSATSGGIRWNYTSDGVTLNGTVYSSASQPSSSTVPQEGLFELSAGTYIPYVDVDGVGIEVVGLNPTQVLSSGGTFTLSANRTVFVRLHVNAGAVYNNTLVHMMLGKAVTYTTALGRTVYGGTLDVVSGMLTVTDANIASYNGETLPSTWISDRDVYSSGTTPTTGAQVVYKLSTPQTYQLTAQEVELLLGTNNLWTDCGDSTVEYGIQPYYNPTEFDAKPLIKVTGTGILGIGEYILTITGTASQTLYIDCETMEIYKLEGTVPTGASSLVSINKADFPVLKPGQNGVSVGSGLSALTIIPKWWRI